MDDRKLEIRHLPCALTNDELLEKGQLAAGCVAELRKLEDEKAEAAKRIGEAIKEKQSEQRRLAHEISTRSEVRPVECRTVALFQTRQMITVREDTGETVEKRPMTDGEVAAMKQGRLFDGDGDGAH